MAWKVTLILLLFVLSSNGVKTDVNDIVDPRQLIHSTIPTTALDVEPYVELQMRLEDIADKSRLYDLSERERIKKEKELLEDPDVQKIIVKCRKFHKQIDCNSTSYRNLDGTCNNLNNPKWGSTYFLNDRLLPPSYNGTNGFRKSVDGKDLPVARSITLKFNNNSRTSRYVSAMFVFFGQTVAHEITLVPSTSKNGKAPNCCDPSLQNRPECLEKAQVVDNDPYYSRFNLTCVGFVRNAPYPSCTFEKRTFMNKINSFIDGSITYGNTEEEAQAVRLQDGSGKLKMLHSIFGDLLPKNKDEYLLFCPINKTEKCFASGDERTNQHTMLMYWQTILSRLHNIIADSLHNLNPHWNGEKIYQESRRLVGAIQQCIVYREFLPLLVGPINMKKYQLNIDFRKGSLYDDKVRPNILSEFNVASFRLHSMVPKEISRNQPNIRMANTYSWSSPIHKGNGSSLLTGSCEVPSEQNDRFFIEDVVGLLYGPHGSSYGFDMAARNIQRGRDHGLPPYIDLVRKCSDGRIMIKNFSDLRKRMTKDNIEVLKRIYTDVRDIETWIGLIVEKAVAGSVTGSTAACISAIQFHRLKFGDRFFFTHTNGRNPFTKEQLKFLKKFSLAKVICATTNVSRVRRNPLKLSGVRNPFVSCNSFCSSNLKAWKDKP